MNLFVICSLALWVFEMVEIFWFPLYHFIVFEANSRHFFFFPFFQVSFFSFISSIFDLWNFSRRSENVYSPYELKARQKEKKGTHRLEVRIIKTWWDCKLPNLILKSIKAEISTRSFTNLIPKFRHFYNKMKRKIRTKLTLIHILFISFSCVLSLLTCLFMIPFRFYSISYWSPKFNSYTSSQIRFVTDLFFFLFLHFVLLCCWTLRSRLKWRYICQRFPSEMRSGGGRKLYGRMDFRLQ